MGAVVTGEPDLISLLRRADWTRLCLSAEVNDGSTLLIAPGKRYRRQHGERVTGCDGDRRWELPGDDGEDGDADGRHGTAHLIGGPEPPLRALLCPAWLLMSSRLEVRGQVSACGRDALHVVVTRRPSIHGRIGPLELGADRVDAIVDAELGILLRIAWMAGRDAPDVTELTSLEVNPDVDPAQFAPPPGSLTSESLGEMLGAGGPLWRAGKTAAGLAAGSLGAWIRYSPFGHGPPRAAGAEDAAAIPNDDPAPELSPAGMPSGPPVSAKVLRLLHDSGSAEWAATLDHWLDVGGMLSQLPAGARRAGFGGLGLLADAIGERPSASRLVSAVRIGGPDKYQVDHAYEPKRGPKTIACDGQRRWQVYADKVTVGPAAPIDSTIADLADASWLLECHLSGGAAIMADGRPAYRINVARGDRPPSLALMSSAAVAVVDAELGILLRLTSYLGDKPVQRFELRDITTGGGAFRVDIPAGLPTVGETGSFEAAREAGRPPPVNFPLHIAGTVARQAATEATKAARNFLRRMDAR
jgi:hypothetical protein